MDREHELREMAKRYRQIAQDYQRAALDYNRRAEELLSIARNLANDSIVADALGNLPAEPILL